MNEREFIDGIGRVTGDVVECTIESLNDDGSYMVRTIDIRALRRATSNLGDNFATGQRVLVQRLSASRNVIGAQDVIISRAPREDRGLSQTTPTESTRSSGGSLIISIDPDPLILITGGVAGDQTIAGAGFETAATYFMRGDGADPIVTDAAAPDASAAEVVMHIAAAADSPIGVFDLAIGSAVARGALHVIPAEATPTTSIYVALLAGLARIDTTDLSIAQQWDAPAAPFPPQCVGGLFVAAGKLYVLYASSALVLDLADGTTTVEPYPVDEFWLNDNGVPAAYTNGKLVSCMRFYGAGNRCLVEGPVPISSSVGDWTAHDSFGGNSIRDLIAANDEAHLVYTAPVRYVMPTETETGVTPFAANEAFGVVRDDDWVYICRDTYVERVDATTMASDATYCDVTTDWADGGPRGLLIAFGDLWAVYEAGDLGVVIRINRADMTIIGGVGLAGSPSFACADGAHLYVAGKTAITKINPTSMTIVLAAEPWTQAFAPRCIGAG